MAYSIRPLVSFERCLNKLDKQISRRVIDKLAMLAENPEIIGSSMSNLPKDLAGLHKISVVDRRDIIYKNLFRKK